jgi:hypothetical protein
VGTLALASAEGSRVVGAVDDPSRIEGANMGSGSVLAAATFASASNVVAAVMPALSDELVLDAELLEAADAAVAATSPEVPPPPPQPVRIRHDAIKIKGMRWRLNWKLVQFMTPLRHACKKLNCRFV